MSFSPRVTRTFVLPLASILVGMLGLAAVAWYGTNRAQAQQPTPPAQVVPLPPPPATSLAQQPLQVVPAGQPLAATKGKKVKRVGSVVGLNEETMQQYILLHEHVWPEVLKRIADSGIRNYTIFCGQVDESNYYLFSYFEYVGDDFEADMAAVAQDPVTRDWWKLTAPLQRRLPGTPVGEQWKQIKQVFHTDGAGAAGD